MATSNELLAITERSCPNNANSMERIQGCGSLGTSSEMRPNDTTPPGGKSGTRKRYLAPNVISIVAPVIALPEPCAIESSILASSPHQYDRRSQPGTTTVSELIVRNRP